MNSYREENKGRFIALADKLSLFAAVDMFTMAT